MYDTAEQRVVLVLRSMLSQCRIELTSAGSRAGEISTRTHLLCRVKYTHHTRVQTNTTTGADYLKNHFPRTSLTSRCCGTSEVCACAHLLRLVDGRHHTRAQTYITVKADYLFCHSPVLPSPPDVVAQVKSAPAHICCAVLAPFTWLGGSSWLCVLSPKHTTFA
jgi:hypothetical protein